MHGPRCPMRPRPGHGGHAAEAGVDHPPFELDSAHTTRQGFVIDRQHVLGLLDFLGSGREQGVGPLRLPGGDTDLPVVTQVAALLGIFAEQRFIADVHHRLIDGLNTRGLCGHDHLRPGMKSLSSGTGAASADVGDEILGAEVDRHHLGRAAAHVYGVDHSAYRFDAADHEALPVHCRARLPQPVDQRD
ncbi:hypothetical protein WJU18_00255 [Ottowia sp. VDI28]